MRYFSPVHNLLYWGGIFMKYWIQRQNKNPIGPFKEAEDAQAFIEKHRLADSRIFGMDSPVLTPEKAV